MIKIALIFNDVKITQSSSALSSPCGSECGNNETEVKTSSSSPPSSSIKFTNHYSSNTVSSSAMRFRHKKIFSHEDDDNNQFFIENEYDNNKKYEITVKHVRTSSFGSCILRSCYELVALLVFRFLHVFCFHFSIEHVIATQASQMQW